MNGSVDPFTALLEVLDRLGTAGRCEGQTRIWDGRRLYELRVSHLGAEELAADRPWSYSGAAVACLLETKRIGGFRREAGKWAKPDAETRRVVWAARTTDNRWVPVRGEFDSTYGKVIGRLKSAPGSATFSVATREINGEVRPAGEDDALDSVNPRKRLGASSPATR